jgi:hypothetical protein
MQQNPSRSNHPPCILVSAQIAQLPIQLEMQLLNLLPTRQ